MVAAFGSYSNRGDEVKQSELEWCIFMAKQSAMELFEIGKLTQVEAEQWMETEAKVRARMKRRGKSWDRDQIARRVRARLAMRKIWTIGRAVAPRPFGGALVTAAESMERLATSLRPVIGKELKK